MVPTFSVWEKMETNKIFPRCLQRKSRQSPKKPRGRVLKVWEVQVFSEEVTLSWVLKRGRCGRKVGERGTRPVLGEGLGDTKALQWGIPESSDNSRQFWMATACCRSMPGALGWAWGATTGGAICSASSWETTLMPGNQLNPKLDSISWTLAAGVFQPFFFLPLRYITWNSGLWFLFLF